MRSGEHLVGLDNGVFRVHTIRAKPTDMKWSPERIQNIAGTPEQPVPGQRYERAPVFMKKFSQAARAHEEFVPQESTPPTIRSWKIYKSDFENPDIGHSPGCPGCRAVVAGMAKQLHTAQCRLRIQEKLMETEEGRQRITRSELRRSAAQPPADAQQGGGIAPPIGEDEDEADLARRIDEARGLSSGATPPAPPGPRPFVPRDHESVTSAQDRLRGMMDSRRGGTKRKAGEHTEDGSRDPDAGGVPDPSAGSSAGGVPAPMPTGGTVPTQNATQQSTSSSSSQGQKRRAEDEPDDPRTQGTHTPHVSACESEKSGLLVSRKSCLLVFPKERIGAQPGVTLQRVFPISTSCLQRRTPLGFWGHSSESEL